MKGKRIRQRGKIKLSQYFKKLNEGDVVALVKEPSVPGNVPKRVIGRTGTVIGTRGSCKLVQINDGNLVKTFIIHPIHLKRINEVKKTVVKTAKTEKVKLTKSEKLKK